MEKERGRRREKKMVRKEKKIPAFMEIISVGYILAR